MPPGAAPQRGRETQRDGQGIRFLRSAAHEAFNLRLQFNKRNASKDEVISALEEILRELRKQ